MVFKITGSKYVTLTLLFKSFLLDLITFYSLIYSVISLKRYKIQTSQAYRMGQKKLNTKLGERILQIGYDLTETWP